MRRYVALHESYAAAYEEAGGADDDRVQNLSASLPFRFNSVLQYFRLTPAPKGYTTYRMLLMEHVEQEEHAKRFESEFRPNIERRTGNRFAPRNCYICRETGHIARDCPKATSASTSTTGTSTTNQSNFTLENVVTSTPNNSRNSKTNSENTQAAGKPEWARFSNYKPRAMNAVIESQESRDIIDRYERKCGYALQAMQTTIGRDEIGTEEAFLDSGADAHMTDDLDHLEDVEELPNNFFIKCADNESRLRGTHIGNLRLLVKNRFGDFARITLSGVVFVPGLSAKLFSVARITYNDEFGVNFRRDYADIYDIESNEIIMSAYNNHGVKIISFQCEIDYELRAFPALTSIADFDMQDDENEDTNTRNTKLWHRRMGHVSASYMVHMSNAAEGVTNFKNPWNIVKYCYTCVLAKSRRNPHNQQRKIPDRILEILATDVLDPTTGPGLDGSKLIVIFVDVFSGYITAYAIRSKAEIPELFESYHKSLMNEFPHEPPVMFRSDNAPELIKGRLEKYLHEVGMKPDSGHPYTPQLNGVCEKRNDLILMKMRALMIESGLPTKYWIYALQVAVHIINRLPSKPNDFKSPYEVLYGGKPDLKYMRVFGTTVMAHICKEVRPAVVRKNTPPEDQIKRAANVKITPRATFTVFLNYKGSGYEILDVIEGTITSSTDLKWFENKTYSELIKQINNTQPPKDADKETAVETRTTQEIEPTVDEEDEETSPEEIAYLGDHNYAVAMLAEVPSRHAPQTLSDCIPKSYHQATLSPFADQWLDAIEKGITGGLVSPITSHPLTR